jgi:SPP1 family predicted phage head-tail adaptor
MQAGALRARVQIQQRALGQDTAGALKPVWTTLGTVWAEMRSIGGVERLAPQLDQTVAMATHQARMRKGAGGIVLRPSMRILWDGRTFEITSVLDPDNREIQQVAMLFEIVEPVHA